MTRPTHARPREPRFQRVALGTAYVIVLATLVVALVWWIASGGPA
ncbi:MAG TPA: hypothetical protein VIU15_38555 [Streptomyces sp.]